MKFVFDDIIAHQSIFNFLYEVISTICFLKVFFIFEAGWIETLENLKILFLNLK